VSPKKNKTGAKITVKPSKYLKKLHPEDVIAQVQAHIQSLKDDLIRYCQKDIDVARNRFLTLTIPVLAWSEQAVWQDKVVGVSDGDGVTVMHHGRSVIDPGSSEKHLFI